MTQYWRVIIHDNLTSSTDSWSYFASAVGSTSNKITFEDLKWIRLYSPHILHAFMCFVFEQMHNLWHRLTSLSERYHDSSDTNDNTTCHYYSETSSTSTAVLLWPWGRCWAIAHWTLLPHNSHTAQLRCCGCSCEGLMARCCCPKAITSEYFDLTLL